VAINIPIFSSLDTKGFDRAKKEFQSLEGFGAKAGYIVKNAMLPIAAAAGGVAAGLGMAAKAAAEDEKSMAQLEGQLRRSVGATQEQIDAVSAYVDQTQLALGVTDTMVRQGLGTLVRATQDTTKAQELMNLALDISAATGKDAETVAIALAKSYGGQLSSLKKLGIPLDEATIKTKDFDAAQRQLADTFGGAAQENANTFSGRVQRLKLRFEEMVEAVGYKVLPILTDLVEKITDLVDAFSEDGLGGVIRVFRGQLQGLTRDSDGTINGFGNFVNALITVRNALGHVLNMFIRLYNVLPFLDNIGTIDMVDQLTTNFGELYGALSKTTQEMERQQKLKGFMGPVASRNLQDLTDYQKAYRDGLRETVDTEEQLTKSSGGSNKKLAEKKKSTEDAAKALKAYNEALTEAVENVRDKFSPALRDANENLTNAQNLYNDFYTGIRKGVTSVLDIGTAWREAADSEGAKSFFGVLSDQSEKAKRLAFNLSFLITRGLDDPTLLQTILNQGTDTGLAISEALIAGGEEGLTKLKDLSAGVSEAADYIAKLSADKWFKSGVDQATKVVEGVQSIINQTEFALKFVVSVEGANQLGAAFGSNVQNVMNGGAPAPMFNPAEFSAAAFMALGQPAGGGGAVRTSSVNINVNGGDPNAVVDALRRYMQSNGSVPIKTTG
jgi:gas vesicle protein